MTTQTVYLHVTYDQPKGVKSGVQIKLFTVKVNEN